MQTILKKIEKFLNDGGIGEGEARAEARLIVESVSGLSTEQILTGEKPSPEAVAQIEQIAQKRVQTRAPIQHLLGFAYFMNEKFSVNENVLIPRDETQILVQCALDKLKELGGKNVLDIGTGSGCIACSLALNKPDIQVLGVDISTAALTVAIENAERLQLINRAVFRKSDLFSNIRESEKFDVIVSNPPYIPLKGSENIQKEVGFDPRQALYTNDDDGLEFYKKIIPRACAFLKQNGFILFELGRFQAQSVKELLLDCGFKGVEITKDLANIERVISAQKT